MEVGIAAVGVLSPRRTSTRGRGRPSTRRFKPTGSLRPAMRLPLRTWAGSTFGPSGSGLPSRADLGLSAELGRWGPGSPGDLGMLHVAEPER